MRKLAVLLPTFNSAPYLKESIDSILDQTFPHFHLYIYDDCSTDETVNVVRSYKDDRIFYLRNEKNLGISRTLNKGFDNLLDNYQFIARMDADDWCYPKRFETQLKMFEEDEDLMMCGTQGYWSGNFEKLPKQNWTYPQKHNMLKLNLLFSSSFGHSSVIFRAKFLRENKIKYNESIKTCEDWELWTRFLELGKVANSSNFLMNYRLVPQSNHRNPANKELHFNERIIAIQKQWLNYGVEIKKRDLHTFYYNKEKIDFIHFKFILKMFIGIFNDLDKLEIKRLRIEDQRYFQYRLARNILKFWKNSGISRYNIETWFLILFKVRFMNKIKLIKNIIR